MSTRQNTSNEGVLDTDVEDFIARQILKYPRERLALSRLLDSKPPKAINCMKKAIAIILFYVIGICLGGTLYAQSIIQNHIDKMNELNYISRSRFFGALSNVCLMGEYFTQHNAIGYYLEQFGNYLKTTADPHPLILMNESMIHSMSNFTKLSSENFDTLMNKLSKQSLEGADIYDYASSLLNVNLPQIVFENHCLINQTNLASLSSIYAQMFAIQRKVSGYESVLTINIDPDVCELANNFVNLYSGSVILYAQISSNHRKEAEKIKKIFKTYSSIVPILSYLIIDVPIVVLHFMSLKTEKDIIQIINSVDKKAKNEAKDNLRSNATEESVVLPEFHPKSGLRLVLLFLYAFIAVVFLLIILVACIIVMRITDNLVKLNEWNQHSASRQSLAAESLNSLLNCIIMIDVPTSYLPSLYPSFIKLAYFIMNKLKESDNNLI
ncbi:hypothetical protein TVAG_420130 [Trichomonas vaginalis G3]|uniref:Uncharacterized protein n=1 Tax=Trichomonas vaginalis (strain ATCC PRA-98 / G3) TaxID=412133 RepID=A2ED36_TRIV3|nr:hypothetical protein TVAG_420130 [Trichomonas vaginalis G3]|eukprot:XP_001321614.1 hypothetical protein [Trichomonas vaginalis G3]